jgi:carbonic anhydrase
MCDQHQHSLHCNHLMRRSFLKALGSASSLGIFGGGFVSAAAYADALTKAQRDEMSPNEIIEVMKKGNERFRTGVRQNRNYLNEQKSECFGTISSGGLAQLY